MHNFSHLAHNPVFWITISFILVVGLIVKKIVPLAINGLDKRNAAIQDDISRAAALRAEAETILEQYHRKEQESLKEAEEIIQKANLEARRITKEAETAAETEVKKRTKLAMEKIEQAERAAMQEVQAKIIDVTIAATQSLLKNQLDKVAQEKLVDAAISDIQQKLH